jgi:hypothetical protein
MDEEQLDECQRSILPACGFHAEDGKKCCLKRTQAETEGVVSGLTFASQILPSKGSKITEVMEFIRSEFYLSIIKLDQVFGFVFMLTLGMIFAFK